MLKNLHIENIAVIERADIEFHNGLNVLSGETGAGKSIIIDSINAVLGNRTSKDIVRTGAEYALVNAVFDSNNVEFWLKENDIEVEDELILQRKITSEGKSTCRVSGVPVSASQLRDLASLLVDIHGQNDGLRLLDEKLHISYLDNFGVDKNLLSSFNESYLKYRSTKKEIEDLTIDEIEKEHLIESLKFTVKEISEANLSDGEYDALVSKRDLLRNSEKLKEALDCAIGSMSEGDDNSLSCTENALYYSSKAASYAVELEDTVSLLKDSYASLKSVSETLIDLRDSLDFSDDEYNCLESRISQINRLMRKYNLDENGLIEHLNKCNNKLDELEYSDERLNKLKNILKQDYQTCICAAESLSKDRKRIALILENRVVNELKDLNMPSVRFHISFERTDVNKTGIDNVIFLMSANAGEDLGKINKIASGGELSRIMLALKNVFAENDIVETMIFDEIDSGVSGISAQRVAEKLWSVSENKQVMCISHLPQIASMADHQYLVVKKERDNRTFTEVNLLDINGRTHEIARMYGGENITDITLNAAQEQIQKSMEYKN